MIHCALSFLLLFARPVFDQEPAPHAPVTFIAHRGGIMPGYPENTLKAYQKAMVENVDGIEVDLRSSRDGEVVIMHDATLDRTTDGKGPVSEYTLVELLTLDAGDGERIPTLQQVLQLVKGSQVRLLLDIKESPNLDKAKVVQQIRKQGFSHNMMVGPRNLKDLAEFQALDPDLVLLGFIKSVADIDSFVQAGVHIIRLQPQWIIADPGIVDKVHRLGKPVYVTAGTAPLAELEKLIKLGVDGILSDFPGMVHTLRE